MAVDWANLTVSREEYDKTLRDSVNAYYEHALNDPSMSRDEAIQSTAQMAEKYENAMVEFDEAAAAQENTSAAQEVVDAAQDNMSEAVESDGIDGGGIDGGNDGGMDGGGME